MLPQSKDTVPNLIEKGRMESVKISSLLGAFAAWVAVIAFLFAELQTNDSRYATVVGISVFMGIALTVANFWANRNKISLAIWISIFAIEITFTIISFFVVNLEIIFAIILLIFVSNLAWQTLSVRKATIAITTAVITCGAIFLVDVLPLNPSRIVPLDWILEGAVIASGIIILILGVGLLRYYQFNSIQTQILVAFVAISVVPLWTVAAPQLIATNSLIQTNANQALSNKAKEITSGFDVRLKHLIDLNLNNASLPIIVKSVQDSAGASQDILDYFQVMEKSDSNTLSYMLLDKNEKVLVNTHGAPVNFDTDVQEAIGYQESSISNISFDPSISKHVFYINSPILHNGNVSGILRAEIDADLFQKFFEQVVNNSDQNQGLTVLLVDQNNIILANSSSPETRFKSITPLKQEQLDALQQKNVLSPGNAENLSVGLDELQKGLDQSDPNFRASMLPKGEVNVVTQRGLANNRSWKVVVGQSLPSLIEPINIQTSITIFIATIVMLIALIAATTTSKLLTSPINYLAIMSERVRRHESDISVKLERRDEIGQLSETINATAIELRHILATLENQVAERTTNLTTVTEDIRQRMNHLRATLEITNTIAPIQNLDELLPKITRQISESLGFYHVGIFLTDQTGQYIVLQASNSVGGKKMLEKGYRVKAGQSSIVGFVVSSGQARIALDVDDDATPFDNPDLPDTRSEIVLPLQNGENIIGALDLQSKDVSAFSPKDIDIFNLLANQISIAIQNARSFEETRSALEEAQLFYRQSATTSWREVLRKGTKGYHYRNGSVEAIKTSGELPEKITRGIVSSPELLTIPINIRGKSLGVLNIRQAGRNHAWSNSEIHVYQSIVDRISFALENARLYQDAQRRASKERVISEIATKVSSSVNMDNILQTAVEELGRVLPGSEVVIQFEQEIVDETNL